MIHGKAEEIIGGPVFQIADVLAHKGLLAPGQTDRVFQFGPTGQYRRHVVLQKHGNRHVAPGTPNGAHVAGTVANDGVVAAQNNLTVVNEKIIGNLSQPPERFNVVDGDRLLAQIGAGHHQSSETGIKQQVMQGRVGQHDAKIAVAG